MRKKLSHVDEEGRARMVDVSSKEITQREARACGSVTLKPETLQLIMQRGISKGDVLGIARVAGIMGAKRTPSLIPMCHPLNITGVEISYHLQPQNHRIEIEATVRITGKTGVEMEALMAVTVTALTIYDMCKAVDRGMVISDIRLIRKSGGKSGIFEAAEEEL